MDKLVALELVERLKNNNFILESKMAELNQKKKKIKKKFKTTRLIRCCVKSLFYLGDK